MALRSTMRIAWRNLGRNRRRTALALGAIAFAELVLVFYEGILTGYTDYVVRAVIGPLVGHAQVHAPKWREDRALDRFLPQVGQRLAAIRALPGVAHATARIYGPTLVAKGEDGEAAVIIGVDFAAERSSGLLAGVPLPRTPRSGEVLLALGTRPRRIVALVVSEGLLLGVIGLAIGAILGSALVLWTARTGVDFSALTGRSGDTISTAGLKGSMEVFPRLSIDGLWRSLLAVLLTSLLAAWWPAMRAARLQPVEAMRA